MKVVTIHLDESVYQDFQKLAKRTKRSTSDLIREAMEQYKKQVLKNRRPIFETSVPASVGQVLQPWKGRGELVCDFLERK